MVQGLRRCQTGAAVPGPLTVGGVTATRREFFTGQPIWVPNPLPGVSGDIHPGGYYRVVDKETGALRWVHVQDPQGAWETGAIW